MSFDMSSSFTVSAAAGLVATYTIYKLLASSISKYLWNKHSILKDIPLLSKARSKGEKIPGTAIICGGSVAGLFASRVCANHFEKVLVIEPEQWVTTREQGIEDHHRDADQPKRSRVAQYNAYHHFHLLITVAMQEMFSTLEQKIRSLGGKFTIRSDVLWISGFPTIAPTQFPSYTSLIGGSGGGRTKPYPCVLGITRPLFETTLRRLVLQTCPEVEYIHGTVTGLIYDETTNKVNGVNVKLPGGENSEIQGALVVDATGPALGGYRWLKAIPKFSDSRHSPSLQDIKISFDPKMCYTTCEFALPAKLDDKFREYNFPSADGKDTTSTVYVSLPRNSVNNRHVIIEKREKNFLHFVCGGYDCRDRVETIEEIREFVNKLELKRPLPEWVDEMLQTLQSEDVPMTYLYSRCPSSVYIKYHEVDYLPSNFVVIGDALSQTDPVNGQGCSKSCANAIILNSQLHRSVITVNHKLTLSPTFSKTYFSEVKDRTEHIWENIKNVDYDFSTTVPLPGESLQNTSRFIRNYGRILGHLTTKDRDISGVLYRQTAWLEPPTDSLAPWVVGRIAWTWIKQSLFGYEIF